MTEHRTDQELQAALTVIRQAPSDTGTVKLIVRRPGVGQREVVGQADLSVETGLQGDNWLARGSGSSTDPAKHREMQINLMNSRVIDAITNGNRERWPLAGDQLYVDFDLSDKNLPPGTQLKVGGVVLEVSEEPHLGCKKFQARFGRDAVMFVNSELGKQLNLRGINAKVIVSGAVSTGDTVSKLTPVAKG